MTKAMALDHAKEQIRVNAICPGDTFVKRWIERDGQAVLGPDETLDSVSVEEIERRLRVSTEIPMGRVGHVLEVAKVVLFLASDESSFISGIALPVDGGNTAQ